MRRPRSAFPAAALAVAALLAGVALLAVAACTSGGATGGGSTGGGAGGSTVVEKGFAFSPNTLTVNVGDTVTFTNQDSAAHEVSIDGQDLGQQATGKSVTWKATTAGTFPFKCIIHPSMTGQVTVGSGGAGGTSTPGGTTTTGGTTGGSAPPASGSGGY
jgi:plastocyanin